MADSLIGAPGKYRWAVKTASDPAAAALKGQAPIPGTIPFLAGLSAPRLTPDLPRQPNAESHVWVIEGTLVGYKAESDQDYHLVVQDTAGHSMIVEIPDPTILEPSCAFPEEIGAARAAFDEKFHEQVKALRFAAEQVGAPLMITKVNTPVRVTGIAYFDEIHGQTGVAPNGIELHPVLKIEFI